MAAPPEVQAQNESEREPEEPFTGEPPAPPPQPRSRRWIWIGAVLLFVVGIALFLWVRGRNRVSTDDAQVNGDIAPISSQIPGKVEQVLVERNQTVEAGQILVRLDPRPYQARVEQSRAALAAAEARANAAQVGVPLTRETTTSGTAGAAAELASAQAQAEQASLEARRAASSGIQVAIANQAQAEAENQRAQADLERVRPLAAKAEISRQQFDSYVASARVAAARVNAAEQQVVAARQTAANLQAAAQSARARVGQAEAALRQSQANQQQVKVSEAQASSARAAILQAQADLKSAELDLFYTTILAPLAGQVTNRSAEPGQVVQPGQALMAIVPLYSVWVRANFKETQLARVRPGDTAEVKVDMYGTTIRGRVESISAATGSQMSLLPPENATGNFVKVVQRIPVRIVFDHLPPGVVLRPGMNVVATIRLR